MTISALSAAHSVCEAGGWNISNLEMQKLLYLAHRTYLGRFNGEPLIDEGFEAWDYGPVVPSLYRTAKIFGADRIRFLPRFSIDPRRPEHRVIREVVEHFADRTPGQLVELTHKPDGAWSRNYRPGRRGIVISDRDVRREYDRIVRHAA